MVVRTCTAACLAALFLAFGDPSLVIGAETQPSFSREQIDALIARLRDNGEKWFADEAVDPAIQRDLKAVTFDEGSVPVLLGAVRAIRLQKDGELYAAERLMRQVLMAKTEVVRGMLPAIKGIHAQVRTDYRRFEPYTGGARAAPPASAPCAEGRKRPLTRLDRDGIVAKHNELAHALEIKTFQAMLRAGDTHDDEQLAEWMLQEEKRGSGVFLDILAAISTAAAAKMDQDRAKRLYDVLNRAGERLRLQAARQYVHPARCKIEENAQSTFETKTANAGVEIVAALNRVATAAKQPAIRAPTKRELDEANKPRKRG
jgi:hypothetical protein